METPPVSPNPPDPDDVEDESVETALVHTSTGRLTGAQALIVGRWRRQLTIPDSRRWHTANGLPPASSSDCIAAAAVDMLDHAIPDRLKLMRYAFRIREQLQSHRAGGFPAGATVSVYLPQFHADLIEQLLDAAHTEHVAVLAEIREQVEAELPGRSNAEARALRMMGQCAARGVPIKAYRLPIGTITRMAIDRWANKTPTTVVAAAVAYGDQYHEQQHRARKDMGVDR